MNGAFKRLRYRDPSAAHEYALQLKRMGFRSITIRPAEGHTYIVEWFAPTPTGGKS